jgi:pyridoxamine 5'-phosphate oxidase
VTDLAALRKHYSLGSLNETEVDRDPIRQFEQWFAHALDAQIPEPNAMTLATVGADGRPSARIVLIKAIDARGFVFFSNYASRKGRDLAHNPQASLLFHWIELERQVRIEGIVTKTSDAESDNYFTSRPAGSRLGAWASEQSSVVASRAVLEEREAYFTRQFGEHAPRPPHWGGYRLVPDTIEFWQGRPSRLHDRLQYRLAPDATWSIVRLAP